MWWYRRGNSGGSWLLEEKKLKCGPEGEIVVAHGCLNSPARWRTYARLGCWYAGLKSIWSEVWMLIFGVREHPPSLDINMEVWRASARFGCWYVGLASICLVQMLIWRVEGHLHGLDVDMQGWRASARFRFGQHLHGLDVDMRGWRASARFGCWYAGLESICNLHGLDVDMWGWRVSARFRCWYAELESICKVRMLTCGVGEHLMCG